MNLVASTARTFLGQLGYVLWKRDFLRFGVDPFLDIARLSRAWGWEIQTVFDVGANSGGFLREALPRFREAQFHSFEPHPTTFARLSAAALGERVQAHQLGLGDTGGTVKFFEYGRDGDGSLINSMAPNARFAVRHGYQAREIEVSCMTLDAFCRQHLIEHVDVLKLDVEGYELAVLRGGEGMLASGHVNFVYAEFNDLKPKTGVTGGSMLALADYLEPFGFRYVATYTDFVIPDGEFYVCANVLFARRGESAA